METVLKETKESGDKPNTWAAERVYLAFPDIEIHNPLCLGDQWEIPGGRVKLVWIPRKYAKIWVKKNVNFQDWKSSVVNFQNEYKVTLFKANQNFTRTYFKSSQGTRDAIPQDSHFI